MENMAYSTTEKKIINAPLISIIIPYYNGGDYIDNTVTAAKKITCSKEILIINDGSTDGSFDRVQRLYCEDSEIVLLTKENGGIVAARNYGVSHAKGKYLVFCDQDDTLVSSTIDKAVNIAQDKDTHVILWSTVMTYKEDRADKKCDTIIQEGLVEGRDVKDKILRQTLTYGSSEYANQIRHLWMGLYNKEFIVSNELTFKRFVTYEDDYLFLIDVMARADRLYLIKEVGYKWFMNRSSASHVSKIIKDYMDKSTRFNSYCEGVMKVAGYDEGKREDVMCFFRQKQISFAILEYVKFSNNANKKKEKRQILTALQDAYNDNIFRECYLSGDKRKTVTHKLLANKHILAAFVYNRWYNTYFELRKIVGAIVWSIVGRR